MATSKLTCRLRVLNPTKNSNDDESPQETAILPLKECPDIDTETRLKWANQVMEHFAKPTESPTSARSWDFIAALDGPVKALPVSEAENGLLTVGYPTRFQIPPTFLDGLDDAEKVSRAEKFAMASLLYEIMTGKQPFEGLTDEEVHERFINGDFPDDAASLPNVMFIYSGWSKKFEMELTERVEEQNVSLVQRATNYAKAHPIRTGIQVVGTTLCVLSTCAVPILGAVGFGAAGPVAGSAAAAWQSSMGAVQAGSLFAWCQSASMGGAALSGVQVAGAAGTALTRVGNLPELVETFKRGFRNPERF